MFSAKGLIQDYLRKYLADWLVDIPQESLQIGILDGDLRLSHLQLKKQSWTVCPGISISLERGRIERFNIQVPWTKIHTGLVNCFVEKVSLIFKLNIIDHEDDNGSEPSLAHDIKMALLAKEELRLLGEKNGHKRSWFSRYMGSVVSSMVMKIAANFNLTANDIDASILLPKSEDEYVSVKLCIESITVANDASASAASTAAKKSSSMRAPSTDECSPDDKSCFATVDDCFLNKNLTIRGLSCKISITRRAFSDRDFAALARNQGQSGSSVILNPCSTTLHFLGRKDDQHSTLDNIRNLRAEVRIRNLELTPRTEHLYLAHDTLSFILNERIKFQFQSIRALILTPFHDVDRRGSLKEKSRRHRRHRSSSAELADSSGDGRSSGKRNGRRSPGKHRHHASHDRAPKDFKELWLFAIRAVLLMVKQRRSGGDFQPRLSKGMERLGLRRKYLALYRKVIDYKLSLDETTRQFMLTPAAGIDADPTTRSPLHAVGSPEGRHHQSANVESQTWERAMPWKAAVPGKSSYTKGDSAPDKASDELKALTSNAPGLQEDERELFHTLHVYFSFSDLILFRQAIHSEYLQKGVSKDALRALLTNNSRFSLFFNWLSIGQSQGSTSPTNEHSQSADQSEEQQNRKVSVPRRRDSAKSLAHDTRMEDREDECQQCSFELSISVSRLAFTLLESLKAMTAKDSSGISFDNESSPSNVSSHVDVENQNPSVGKGLLNYTVPQALPDWKKPKTVATSSSSDKLSDSTITSASDQEMTKARSESSGGSDRLHSAPKTSIRAHSPLQCLSFILYGLHSEVVLNSKYDKTLKVTLGVVKCFGHGGVTILDCGGDPNIYILAAQNNRNAVEDSGPANCLSCVVELRRNEVIQHAASMNSKRRSHASDAEDARSQQSSHSDSNSTSSWSSDETETSDADGRASSDSFTGNTNDSIGSEEQRKKNILIPSKRHYSIVLRVEPVNFWWHQKTFILVSQLSHAVLPSSAMRVNPRLFSEMKLNLAELSAYQGSEEVRIPSKISIDAVAGGLTASIPLSGILDASLDAPLLSGTSRRKTARLDANVLQTNTGRSIQFSLGEVSFISGDCLNSALDLDNSTAKDQDADEEEEDAEADEEANSVVDIDSSSYSSSPVARTQERRRGGGQWSALFCPANILSNSRSSIDYSVQSSPPSTRLSDEDAAQEETPDTEVLRDCVMKIRRPIVVPVLFQVADVQLKIITSSPKQMCPCGEFSCEGKCGLQPKPTGSSLLKLFQPISSEPSESDFDSHSLTASPWSLRGVLSSRSPGTHPIYTDIGMYLFCAPLQLTLTTQDIMCVIDSIREIKTVFLPKNIDGFREPIPPRIERLSALSCTFIDAKIKQLDVEFLVEKRKFLSTSKVMANALEQYGSLVLSRGVGSFVTNTRKSVAIQQLLNCGISHQKVDSIIRSITKALSQGEGILAEVVEHALDELHMLGVTHDSVPVSSRGRPRSSGSKESIPLPLPVYCRPILFHLNVKEVAFGYHSLTYDVQMVGSVKELSIFDKERVPIISFVHSIPSRVEHFPHLFEHLKRDVNHNAQSDKETIPAVRKAPNSRSLGQAIQERPSLRSQSRSTRLGGAGSERFNGALRGSISRSRDYTSAAEYEGDSAIESKDDNDQFDPRECPNYDSYFDMSVLEEQNSFVIIYEEKAHGREFGTSGHDISALYKQLTSDVYDKREGKLEVAGYSIDVQLATVSVIEIIEQFTASLSQAWNHYTESRAFVRKALNMKREYQRRMRNRNSEGIFESLVNRASFRSGGPSTLLPFHKDRRSSLSSHTFDPPRGGSSASQQHSAAESQRRPDSLKRRPPSVASADKLKNQQIIVQTYVHTHETVLFINTRIQQCAISASFEDQYLARCSMYSIAISASDIFNIVRRRAACVRIGSLSVLDLTLVGSLHPEVVWRKNDNEPRETIPPPDTNNDDILSDVHAVKAYEEQPVIVINFHQLYSGFEDMYETLSIKVDVDGLRLCCLYRFVLELMDYAQNKLLAPLNQFLDSFKNHSQLLKQHVSQDAYLDELQASFDGSMRRSGSEFSSSDSDYSFSDDDSYSSDSLVFSDDEGQEGTHEKAQHDTASSGSSRSESRGTVHDIPLGDAMKAKQHPHSAKTVTAITVKFKDVAVIVPRNSTSRDLVAFRAASGLITLDKVFEPLTEPTDFEHLASSLGSIDDDDPPLFFDTRSNRWKYGTSMKLSPGPNSRAPGNSKQTIFGPQQQQEVLYPSDATASRQRSSSFAAKLLRQHSPGEVLSPSMRESLSINLSEDGEEDGVAKDNPRFAAEDDKTVDRIAVEISGVRAFLSLAGPLTDPAGKDGARGASLNSPPAPAADQGTTAYTLEIDSAEHKIFRELDDNALVNTFLRKSTSSTGAWAINQAWREISAHPFNLMVVFDQAPTVTKLLLGDTSVLSQIKLNLSQSGFYLIMGLWFDNMHEVARYPSEDSRSAMEAKTPSSHFVSTKHSVFDSDDSDDPMIPDVDDSKKMRRPVRFSLAEERGISEMNLKRSTSSASFADYGMEQQEHMSGRKSSSDRSKGRRSSLRTEVRAQIATYGTKEYLKFVMNRVATWEILVVRAEIRIGCSIDSNYFPMDIPNEVALADMEPGSGPQAHMDTAMGVSRSEAREQNVRFIPTSLSGAGATKAEAAEPFILNPHHRSRSIGGTGRRSGKSYDLNSEHGSKTNTADFVQNAQKKFYSSKWVNKVLPLCDISVSGLVLHVKMDSDVLQLSAGAGKVEVYDNRRPKKTLIPYALRLAPPSDPTTKSHAQNSNITSTAHRGSYTASPDPAAAGRRRVYGTSDFEYGFKLLPSDVEVPCDIPFKVALVMATSTNWITTNIGMDMLDLNVQSPDLILLISDFFSCYFRFPQFGHPGVHAYDRLASKTDLPYGGVDTRVFISRPHISLLKFPLLVHSQALLLETEGGLYFRYTLDTNKTVKMDLNIYNLALILVKRFRPPVAYRGIRGSSGSGKGVRTLVEFFNVALAYHLVTADNHLDLKIDIYCPPLEDDDDDSVQGGTSAADHDRFDDTQLVNSGNGGVLGRRVSFVDFEAQSLQLSATNIPRPHCVFPLVSPKTDFTSHSCDIVSSYEDLLFCIVLAQDFLKLNQNDATAGAASGRGRKGDKKVGTKGSDGKKKGRQSKSSGNDAGQPGFLDSLGLETDDADQHQKSSADQPCEIFGVLSLSGIRFMIVDNVLGLHLPLIQAFLDEFQCTLNRIDPIKAAQDVVLTDAASSTFRSRPTSLDIRRSSAVIRRDTLTNELAKLSTIAQSNFGTNTYIDATATDAIDLSTSALDMMVYGRFVVWAEYFNNMRKCWEPLMEKLAASVLFEKSMIRGTGITIRAESAIHMNISGAFFRTLNDILVTVQSHQDLPHSQGSNSVDRSMVRLPAGEMDDLMFTEDSEPMMDQSFIAVKAERAGAVPLLQRQQQQQGQHQYARRSSIAQSPSPSPKPTAAVPQLNRWASARPGFAPKRTRKKTKAFGMSLGDATTECSAGSRGGSYAPSSNSSHELDHIPSNPLGATFRVGFSIENLTGQPVRYLQQWEGERRTVQYLNHNERGLLNFVASKTNIRNGQVVEETFDVQMERNVEDARSRNRRKAVGNRVALQVAGYRWLHAVQADELGVRYEELYSVLGRVQATQLYRNPLLANALKLMVEVLPYCGGRMLRLRSVFTIKNNTRHALKISAREGTATFSQSDSTEDQDAPFQLDSGDKFHVPLALLRRSVLKSSGTSLGSLFLRPADLAPIEEELASRPNVQPGLVDYSKDPINLFRTVDTSNEVAMAKRQDVRPSIDNLESLMGVHRDNPLYSAAGKDGYMQLSCEIHPKALSRYGANRKHNTSSVDYKNEQSRRATAEAMLNKLPPFCYCVEVQRDTDGFGEIAKSGSQSLSLASRFFAHSRIAKNAAMSPANFTITIHPPIVIENLLPCSGSFELVHAVQKRVLWSSWIAAGTAKPVHTVTLEEPMLLLINLKYCRSSEGALIHQPRRSSDSNEGIAGKFQRALDSLLEEGMDEEGITSVMLTDTVGQRLRLNVENTLGGGGQRQIAVYCPYWIVNTSQYSFRIIEEGKMSTTLPAGTVTAQKDGTRPVPHSGMTFAEMQLHSGEHDTGNRATSALQGASALRPAQGTHPTQFPSSSGGVGGASSSIAYPSMVGNTASSTGTGQYQYNPRNSTATPHGGQLHSHHGSMYLHSAPNQHSSAYVVRRLTKHGSTTAIAHAGTASQRSSTASAVSHLYRGDRVVSPGCYGPLHSLHHREFSTNSPLRHLIQELEFNDIVELSYMFNYASESSRLSSKQRVKVQFDDSEWSRPFSLDSVGVTQSLAIDHKLRGNLEVGFKINVAPGRLAKYTKIVRLLPRFTIVNKLDTALKVLQPIGFAGDTRDIEVSAQHMRPYHLPALFGERKLALQVGSSWQRTVAFSIDQIGIFTMEVRRKIDLADIQHVNTRGAAEYKVTIPEDQKTLGIYFETDWGEENIVVKDIQKGSFAANETDVKVGDVLLSVLGEPMSGSTFELAMVLLRKCVTDGGVVKFRTVEEKIRLIRETAWKVSQNNTMRRRRATLLSGRAAEADGDEGKELEEEMLGQMASPIQPAEEYQRMILRIELRQIESSVMIVVNELREQHSSEYRIENQSVCFKMYYKQKGITGNKWNALQPGQSIAYVWEDPFKPHKLQVLMGDNTLSPGTNYGSYGTQSSSNSAVAASHFSMKGKGEDTIGTYWGYLAGMRIDQAVVVSLDEIGSKEMLSLPSSRGDVKMLAVVKSEGPTKILLVAPSLDSRHLLRELRYCIEFLQFQIMSLQDIIVKWANLNEYLENPENFSSALRLLSDSFEYGLQRMRSTQKRLVENDHEMNADAALSSAQSSGALTEAGVDSSSANKHNAHMRNDSLALRSYRPMERVLDTGIVQKNQLEITVLEGKELTPLVVGKQEDVYCKLFLRADDLASQTGRSFSQRHYTYVSDQTLDPAWQDQRFVFSVPEKAAQDPRRFYLRIVVKARSIVGLDATLGKMDIDLTCLREERALEGWFPLRPPRMSLLALSNATGSLKLRIQWVHSDVGYANYLGDEVESRLDFLNLQLNVQKYALKHLQKQESNRNSLNPKKRRAPGKKDIDKDYYDLFEALQKRERRSRKRSALHMLREPISPRSVESGSLPSSPATSRPTSGALTLIPSMSRKSAGFHNKFSDEKAAASAPISVKIAAMSALNCSSKSHRLELSTDEVKAEDKEDEGGSDDDIGFSPKAAATAMKLSDTEIEGEAAATVEEDDAEFDETRIHGLLKPDSQKMGKVSISSPAIVHRSSLKPSLSMPLSRDSGRKTSTSPRHKSTQRHYSLSTTQGDATVAAPAPALRSLRKIPFARYGHDRIMHEWKDESSQHQPLHRTLSSSMDRPASTVYDNQVFHTRFDSECHRNFDHVRTLGGVLEITPMQALHLPDCTRPMLVRVSYGDQSQSTFKMPPAAYLTWYQEKSNSEVFSARDMDAATRDELHPEDAAHDALATAAKRENTLNDSLAKRFTIDTLNIKGAVRVSVLTEGIAKAKEVAYVELPVFNLLDCCVVLEDVPYYDRWFPLLVSSESKPIEGNIDRLNRQLMAEQAVHSAFEYHPCIRLRIRWMPSEDVQSIEDSKLYARVQVPCFSVGVVDSVHAREVMLAALRGVEFRHAVATDFTDSSLNVTWLQVDNELPDPVAPVILSPTQQKHPQPVIRLHVRKKNLLSQSKLNSFETIQLVVQELDLRLEQQTVVATWELVKSLLQERKYNSAQGGGNQSQPVFSDSHYANSGKSDGTSIDSLGFSTCTELVQYELLPTLDSAAATQKSSPAASPAKRMSSISSDFSEDAPGVFSMYMEDDVSTMYIEDFKIFPIKLNVSFITTPQVMAPSQKLKQGSDMRSAGTVGLYSGLSLFFWQVGEVVLNLTSTISDAPIHFNGFVAPHMFKSEADVAKILQDHYLHSALGQLYKIVGSLELVGNPIGLLSSLGTGVRDFFYEPAHALITTPTELRKIGRGVIKGALSLVSNTTVGFLGTGINITRSIGRGVAKLSMDKAYILKREELMRPPSSLKDAALRPVRDLGVGFYYGVVGLVKVPYNSVQRHGAKALVSGVAKGVVGLAANPVVGVLDAVAHSGDAIRDAMKIANRENLHPVQRLRLSEVFGPDGRILPYSYENAIGTQILHALDRSNEERIKVSNAINGGVGLLMSAGSYLNPLGEEIAMNRAHSRFGGRVHSNSAGATRSRRGSDRMFSHRRGSLKDGEEGGLREKTGMVLRRNRFSYVAPKSDAEHLDLHQLLMTQNNRKAGGGTTNPLAAYNSAIADADEEEDEDGPPSMVDMHDFKAAKEYVVYTAMIRQDASMDLVAVLSTERLVVTEYHHNKHGGFLREQWNSALDQLEAPRFERTGGKATLLLRSSSASISTFAAASARKQSIIGGGGGGGASVGKRSTITESNGTPTIFESLDFSAITQRNYNYLLVANYNEEDVIINMFNCIHVLLGAYSSLIPTYNPENSVCEEDDQGIVHIGPWQYVLESSTTHNYGQSVNEQMDSSAMETQEIIKELELERWVHGVNASAVQTSGEKSPDATAPYWLTAEQEAAVDSHSSIRQIFEFTTEVLKEYKKNPKSKVMFKDAIDKLYKGRLSYDAFLKMCESWQTAADDSSVNSDSQQWPPNPRIGKKHRKRSTFFFGLGMGGENKDDDAATVRTTESARKRTDSEDGGTIAKGMGNMITASVKGVSAAVAFTNRRFSDIVFARGNSSTPIQELDVSVGNGSVASAETGNTTVAATAVTHAAVAATASAGELALETSTRSAESGKQTSTRVPFRAINALNIDSDDVAPPQQQQQQQAHRMQPLLPHFYRQPDVAVKKSHNMAAKLDGWEAAVRLSNHLKAVTPSELRCFEFPAIDDDPNAASAGTTLAADQHDVSRIEEEEEDEEEEKDADDEEKRDAEVDCDVPDNDSSPGHTVVKGAGAEIDSDFFSYSHLESGDQDHHIHTINNSAGRDSNATSEEQQLQQLRKIPSTVQINSKSGSFKLSGTYKPMNLRALSEHRRLSGDTINSADVSPLADSAATTPNKNPTSTFAIQQPEFSTASATDSAIASNNRRSSGRFMPVMVGSNPLFRPRGSSRKDSGSGDNADSAAVDTAGDGEYEVPARKRMSDAELADIQRKRVSNASTVASQLFSSIASNSDDASDLDSDGDSAANAADSSEPGDVLNRLPFHNAHSRPASMDARKQPGTVDDSAFDVSVAQVDFNSDAHYNSPTQGSWFEAVSAGFKDADKSTEHSERSSPRVLPPVQPRWRLNSDESASGWFSTQQPEGAGPRMSFDAFSESGVSIQSAAMSVMMNRLDRMENLLIRAVEGGSLQQGSVSAGSSIANASLDNSPRQQRTMNQRDRNAAASDATFNDAAVASSEGLPQNSHTARVSNSSGFSTSENGRIHLNPASNGFNIVDQTPPIIVRRDAEEERAVDELDSVHSRCSSNESFEVTDPVPSRTVPLLNPIIETAANEVLMTVPETNESLRELERVPSEMDVMWSGGTPARNTNIVMSVADLTDGINAAAVSDNSDADSDSDADDSTVHSEATKLAADRRRFRASGRFQIVEEKHDLFQVHNNLNHQQQQQHQKKEEPKQEENRVGEDMAAQDYSHRKFDARPLYLQQRHEVETKFPENSTGDFNGAH